MIRALVASMAVGTMAPATAAAEFHFFCEFQASVVPVSDPVAREWVESSYFRTREFVLDLDGQKITDGPGPSAFWGMPSIQVDPKEIRINWEVKAKPLDRRPRVAMTINRFSGKVLDVFLMKDESKTGPDYAYAMRDGVCEISSRKL